MNHQIIGLDNFLYEIAVTPGARVSAVIEILDQYLEKKSDTRLVNKWFRNNRFAGSKDKQVIRDLVYRCLRYQLSFYWPFKQAGLLMSGRTIVLGMLRVFDQCFEEIFDGKHYSPKDLTDEEKAVLSNFDQRLASVPAFVKFNFPEFLENSLKESFGHSFEKNLSALSSRADLFIRLNRIKGNIEFVVKSLKNDGIMVERIPNCENSLKVIGNKSKFNKSKAYLSGQVEIQDIHSQLVVEFIDPKENTKVLDFCAGAGGKTLAIASITQGNAEYFVYDKSKTKHPNLKARCQRAGVKIEFLNFQKANQKNDKFDLVVADVPCSATGVWRRNPGNKWQMTKEKLDLIIADQKQILKNAARFVKNGGRLAYITCSVLRSENQDQVNWFLSRETTFSFQANKVLSPIDGGDGFYVSILIKDP